jgi:hypothetical protein
MRRKKASGNLFRGLQELANDGLRGKAGPDGGISRSPPPRRVKRVAVEGGRPRGRRSRLIAIGRVGLGSWAGMEVSIGCVACEASQVVALASSLSTMKRSTGSRL